MTTHQKRRAQLIASAVAAVMFAVMAVEALGFRETAMWYPLYTGILGVLVSLVAVVVGLVALLRGRLPAGQRGSAKQGAGTSTAVETVAEQTDVTDSNSAGSDPEDRAEAESTEQAEESIEAAAQVGGAPNQGESGRTLIAGFKWLGVWLGYALFVLLVGFIAASAVWAVVWFRTVVKWSIRRVTITAAVITAALIAAEKYLNMGMPGGTGLLGALFG